LTRWPSSPGWIHEIKHDGYRMMVRRDGSGVRLLTGNGFNEQIFGANGQILGRDQSD
jgi:hypothetical protein